MEIEGDFILTLSDHDGDLTSNLDDSETEHTPQKANNGKKRKRGVQYDNGEDKSCRKIKKSQLPPNSNNVKKKQAAREASTSEDERDQPGQQDEAIDPDFEFDFGPNYLANTTDDFDGWDLATRPRNNTDKGRNAVKKAVDVDEIIGRRASNKQKSDENTINGMTHTSSVDGDES